MISSKLAWFLTPNGRKFAAISALTGACSFSLASYLPETALLSAHRSFVEMRKGDEAVPVPPKLQSLFTQVMNDLSLNSYYQMISKPFMVCGFEPYHMGSLNARTGVGIGLPVNFSFENAAQIKKDTAFFRQEPINWSREDAQQLLESLLLSEDAIKYAMGRELLMTNNNSIIWQSLNCGAMLGACYGVSSQINTSLKLYEKVRAMRLAIFTLSALFFWGLWSLHKDTLIRYYEGDADEHLAHLGESYIKGGIEFYDKLQKRNKALRTLFDGTAAGAFNNEGDEIFFFRQKHIPISNRKEFFEKKLKEKRGNTEKPEIVEGIAEAAVN